MTACVLYLHPHTKNFSTSEWLLVRYYTHTYTRKNSVRERLHVCLPSPTHLNIFASKLRLVCVYTHTPTHTQTPTIVEYENDCLGALPSLTHLFVFRMTACALLHPYTPKIVQYKNDCLCALFTLTHTLKSFNHQNDCLCAFTLTQTPQCKNGYLCAFPHPQTKIRMTAYCAFLHQQIPKIVQHENYCLCDLPSPTHSNLFSIRVTACALLHSRTHPKLFSMRMIACVLYPRPHT
jgi:hypothetical protein